MRITVFTTDMPPLPGIPTSGTALRTYGLAQGLRAHGHEVIICPPRDAVEGFEKSFHGTEAFSGVQKEFKELKELAFDPYNQADLINNLNPDAILCGHWPALMLNAKPEQPVIVDLPGPYLLERFYQGDQDHKGASLAKLKVLSLADYFIVSGPSQRLYFLSYLMRAGVKKPESRIRTITMPLNPNLPERKPRKVEFPHFIFGGVFLPWQDPSWALTFLSDSIQQRNKGRLSLIGGPHPNYPVDEGSYDTLFKAIAQNERVERQPMLPLEKFVDRMNEADVAIDLMDWNLERQLAVTIRTTTYLWAGLPVIYNDYADLSKLIRWYDAGWLVRPGDKEALETVLNIIFTNPDEVLRKSRNARMLAQHEFAWNRAIEPLLDLFTVPDSSSYKETDIIIERPDTAHTFVVNSKPIEQYFVCRVDGFSRLEWNVSTRSRRIGKPVTLRVFEVDTDPSSTPRKLTVLGKRLVSEQSVKPDSIRDSDWLALDFEPVPESAGKVFSFQMVSEEENPLHAISPWLAKCSPYPMLALAHGNNPIDQHCLCIRTLGSCSSRSSNAH